MQFRGSVGAILEVLVYLTEQPIPISYLYPVTGAKQTEYYQSSTSKYLAKNYYLKTSKVTYSAANLFASIFKDMNLGAIMGENTNGGASAITYSVLPDGAIITSSSNLVFINENSEVIEEGISVDSKAKYDTSHNIYLFKNILETRSSLKFTYDNLSDILHFNLSIEGNLEGIEFEKFTLTINDYYTGNLVKEYVFTDLAFTDSFKKPINSQDFTVKLRAKYKYKNIYSDELLDLGGVDRDLGVVGDYHYREVNVGESFLINILDSGDLDVVKLNITESGVYTVDNKSSSSRITIYDEDFNGMGFFNELILSEGIYYVVINDNDGNHEYTIKKLVDDNEENILINLVNGENQFSVLLDYYHDDEILEFTLDEDKIITLGTNYYFEYQILDEDGHNIDSHKQEYESYDDYTYRFTKGTYFIKIYHGQGLVYLHLDVIDNVNDYADNFSNVKEFGKLLFDENLIIIDGYNDMDIYYVDIVEKGDYVFTGDDLDIFIIDKYGNKNNIPMYVVTELEEGRHYFAFSDFTSTSMIKAKVKFTQIIDESDENNHKSINIGEEVKTIINNELDDDYFDFTINESGVYRIDFQASSSVRYNLIQGNTILLGLENQSNEIYLNEGNYTIYFYQSNGTTIKNAVFTISKK